MKTQIITITSFVLCLSVLMATVSDLAEESAEASNHEAHDLTSVSSAVLDIWPEGSCESYTSPLSGIITVAFACNYGYGFTHREKFLDILFKNGFILKDESYQIENETGNYSYKTEFPEGSKRYIYFRLFFRSAAFLWPNKSSKSLIALFIHDLYNTTDLLRWQTLGKPLTFGVMPYTGKTKELAEKIISYRQELWLNLNLEPSKIPPGIEKVLTIKDAADEEKLRIYIDEAIDDTEKITGISQSLGDIFTQDVYAMRQMFTAVKEKQIGYYLDSMLSKKSVGYETAKLMSFKSYRTDLRISNTTDTNVISRDFSSAMSVLYKKGYIILNVPADNKKVFDFIKKQIATKKEMRFIRISELVHSQY